MTPEILWGFGVGEIAAAFLSTDAATRKRTSRAKRVLAGSKRLFDLKGADFSARLRGARELELRCDRHDVARQHFQAALALARNPMERRFLEQRVSACAPADPARFYPSLRAR